MARTVTIFLAVLLLAYLALCAALFAWQRSMIYFPQPRLEGSPASTLQLKVSDAELVLTARPMAGPKALIYFGGNAEDVSANLPSFSQAFPGHAIYLLHYRGYGGSSGSPSEAALQGDALALFDHVSKTHADITVVGTQPGFRRGCLGRQPAAGVAPDPGHALQQHPGAGRAALSLLPGLLAAASTSSNPGNTRPRSRR
jgi:hypothetical protein